MTRLYNSTENGYPGDEDQGQTSSWYVLSALGFYSVCPGTDQYVLGSPLFKKVTVTMEDGRKFVIEAEGNIRTYRTGLILFRQRINDEKKDGKPYCDFPSFLLLFV